MSMDEHALRRSMTDLEIAIDDSIAVYEKLLMKSARQTDALRSLETEDLRDVVDSKAVLSSLASKIEERRQTAASQVAEILGVERDASPAEILAALPDGAGGGLWRAARELSATITKLRGANDRNRSIAECGIYLTSKLISGMAPIYMQGFAYSNGGNSVLGDHASIIDFAG